ncbi:kinectin-like [Copidosoma floridanum]|uniref:kinectin-like n=1 Tax=Copidosoma floridanum TaxID=29053 RepID=UPI0006C9BD25|nr:kinectin-like [Copidosoma floridanum]
MSKEEQKNLTDSALGDKMQWSMLPNNLNPTVASDDHLQGSGLVVSDGLPRFKLNEPGPAALASSIFQQNNMVNDESEQSFVVLGQSSLDSIRETSLANYVEIQKKSLSIDHSSLVSMMSPNEMEDSLKKVLEENLRLKETLKHNNTTIKQQFSTITQWQKEVMAVCDGHKQKFIETKELINKLKIENEELRDKITKSQSPVSSTHSTLNNLTKDALTTSGNSRLLQNMNFSAFTEENKSHGGRSMLESEHKLEKKFDSLSEDLSTLKSDLEKTTTLNSENLPELQSINSSTIEEDDKSRGDQVALESELKLVRKIDTLSEELSALKVDHSKSQEIFQELEKRYITDIQFFSQLMHKANKGFDDFKKNCVVSNSSELQKLVNKCCEKDNEISYLKEIITSFEQQIKKFEENALATADSNLEISGEPNKDKLLLKENVEFYHEKVNELNKCFASQCSRHLRIQEFLKESVDIIQALENAEVLPNSEILADKLKAYKDELCNYRKKLIDEQLQSIDDKLTTIKIQKQFQKILSDYNAVVYELEILRDENSKLQTLQVKAGEENSRKLADIEKHLDEEKKVLDEEKTALLEAQLNMHMHKKSISEERDKLQAEQTRLCMEKEWLSEEKTSLIEEKTSLDRQSKLYEAEEGTLQKEKKILQKKCDDLNNEIVKLKQELNLSDVTIQQLRADNAKLQENEELISVYKIQIDMYEKEFDEIRVSQKNLQEQLQSLSMANIELRTENDRLGGSVSSNEDSRQQQQQQQDQRPVAEENQHRFCERCQRFLVPGEIHNSSDCMRIALMEFD